MLITLTSKRQATFPVEVCKAMRIPPGSRLELVPGDQPDEWIIRPFRVRFERLAPLRGKLPRGVGSFDLKTFRDTFKDHAAPRNYPARAKGISS